MTLDASVIPPAPQPNDEANAFKESPETLALLARRRSTKLAFLAAPGPDAAQLAALLRLAARAPDHGKLGPWRFIVIEGDARARAGEAVAAALPNANEDRRALERARFLAAPLCVAVVSTAAPHAKIPEWEQQLSAGAVCYGLLIAAHAMGFAGTWLTEWIAYDAAARAALGLQEAERLAGLVFLGAATAPALERERPSAESRITYF